MTDSAPIKSAREQLLDGPMRAIALTVPHDVMVRISEYGELKGFGPKIRLLCYGFIMAEKDFGSTWQIDEVVSHAKSTDDRGRMVRTSVKMPDGMCEEIERICEGVGVSVSAFIRSVACLSSRFLEDGNV